MRYEKENLGTLEQAKAEADRKMLEIAAALAPGVDVATPDDLKTYLERRLAEAKPAEREALRRKVALAVADLRDLSAMLNRHLSDIRDELGTLEGHRGAASAYGRAAAPGKVPGY